MPLIFNMTCQLIPISVKNVLNLFAMSTSSTIIDSASLKYFGSVFFLLYLQRISFIVFHVFLISDWNLLKHVSK